MAASYYGSNYYSSNYYGSNYYGPQQDETPAGNAGWINKQQDEDDILVLIHAFLHVVE